MALIRIPTQTWQELDGVQEPFSIRQFRGVSKLNPMALEPGYAAELSNLSAEGFPSLRVRGGMTRLAQVPNAQDGVTGVGVHEYGDILVIADGSARSINLASGDGQLSSPLLTGLSQYSNWSFTNFKGNYPNPHLLAANGTNPIVKFYPPGNQISQLSNAPTVNYITSHADRIYGAVGNTLHFSALRNAEDWNTPNDSGQIVVDSPGGRITGICSGLERLLVFKEESTHELYGTGPNNYRLVLVSDKIGCLANNSAVLLEGTIYWLARTGIYAYSGGSMPRKDFSLPVQGYVDRVSIASVSTACAATDGKRYYVALPVQSNWPNIILEYDPTFQTWMVWQPPAQVQSLSSFKGSVYAGLRDGRVAVFDPSSTTDDGQTIQWFWESPPIGSGSYITRKRWYDMWIVVDLPTGSTLEIYLSPKAEGNDSWTKVRSITASADMQSARIILPIQPIANANWLRIRLAGTGPCTVHELAYRERIFPI